MNNDNKPKKPKLRKCKGCYNKFPKSEIVISQGSYRCEPCDKSHQTLNTIASLIVGITLGILIFIFFCEIRRKNDD